MEVVDIPAQARCREIELISDPSARLDRAERRQVKGERDQLLGFHIDYRACSVEGRGQGGIAGGMVTQLWGSSS